MSDADHEDEQDRAYLRQIALEATQKAEAYAARRGKEWIADVAQGWRGAADALE